MAPADLASELERAIDRVIDIDLYNQELAAEEADSAQMSKEEKGMSEDL